MPENTNIQELDFNRDDYNSFYYTNEKQIKRMDDEFILSKITERYPDFHKDNTENTLKQVLVLIVSDSKLINEIEKEYDVPATELFKILYRNYEFVFNKCFITRIQKAIKGKKYARLAKRGTRKFARRESWNAGKAVQIPQTVHNSKHILKTSHRKNKL